MKLLSKLTTISNFNIISDDQSGSTGSSNKEGGEEDCLHHEVSVSSILRDKILFVLVMKCVM